MDIIKVGILGVAAVLMAIPLRKEKQEYSMFLSMAVCICIFIYIITKVQIVLEFVEKLEGMIAIDSTYIGLVIKMVGITYACLLYTSMEKPESKTGRKTGSGTNVRYE